MFLTPIFYPVDIVPEGLAWMLRVNFLHHLVSAYRAVLIEGTSPLASLPYLLVGTALVVVLGLWFFRRTVDRAKDFL
jgi:ABC-type polysaccharide/polyol phosphate export permease